MSREKRDVEVLAMKAMQLRVIIILRLVQISVKRARGQVRWRSTILPSGIRAGARNNQSVHQTI